MVASSTRGIALYAKGTSNLAARFDGNVEVHGAFSVVGGPKSAIVRHRDGTHRQLYCVESPESWFEDFGEARLVKGVAKVKLDPDFAALIDTGKYQVFVTSYDPVQLFVAKRTRQGFEIRAIPGPDGNTPGSARCGYRIVARRKDVAAPRLAKVKVSKSVKHPRLPKLSPAKMPAAMKRSLTAPLVVASPALPPAPQVPEVRAPEIPLAEGEE